MGVSKSAKLWTLKKIRRSSYSGPMMEYKKGDRLLASALAPALWAGDSKQSS